MMRSVHTELLRHTRAERVVGTLELLARRKIVALSRDAFEVVCVVLEAVPGLIRVGEPGYAT